jgi:hypothetical protein
MQSHTVPACHPDVRHARVPMWPLLLIGLLCLLSLVATQAQAHPAADRRGAGTVTVNGEGSVLAIPDQADLQLGVQAQNTDVNVAREEVSRRSGAVLAYLAQTGLPERHINATHISVEPQYRWDREREEQILTGYLVERSIEVRITDLSLFAAVVEGSADAGANRIAAPRLSHSDEDALRREALRLATADARANAAAVALALDVPLGDVVEVNALGASRPMPIAGDAMLRAASMEKATDEAGYQAGEMRFEARVQASFRLRRSGPDV